MVLEETTVQGKATVGRVCCGPDNWPAGCPTPNCSERREERREERSEYKYRARYNENVVVLGHFNSPLAATYHADVTVVVSRLNSLVLTQHSLYRELHVGLSRAEVDVPEQNVRQGRSFRGLGALHAQAVWREAGGRGRKSQVPTVVGAVVRG